MYLKRLSILMFMLLAPNALGFTPRSPKDLLSEQDAQDRARWIANPKYQIDVDLTDTAPTADYRGRIKMTFDVKEIPLELTIDFRGGQLQTSRVNGKNYNLKHNGAFITVPGDTLSKGKNNLELSFTHPYSKDGSGLYRFVDPVDQNIYVYTDFEPYDASRFVPLFDQPDLRATYAITATVPASWQVISSVSESNVSTVDQKYKRWEFPESANFSTYILPLHAGPFHVWEDKVGDIPLRLMVRQSMKQHVPKDFWMTITKQGMTFFDKYFAVKYPFIKYDQVIVPDFNSGAMENVAAVTFSERYLRKGAQTRRERERMADVILHEMAHMWFGNLVTMRWWNDLWLNESFATYMANLALAEATEFKEAWLSFQDTKQWAYWEDDLVTKHPITTAVPDTNQAFANFDGITYGKGASVLKQLSFYLGHDVFKQGIQRYFSQYSWKNTELKDFIGSLEQSARRDLKQFTNEWLETQGTNTIKPVYSCENGKIDTFYIRQHAQPGELQSRSHRAILALVKKNDEKTLSLMETIAYTYSGPQTSIEEAKGKPCPDFVYPNYEDHDFVKVELDARSLDTASQSLRFLDDSLLRGLVWSTLWDMVRQSKLTIQSYGDLAKNHIFVEENLQITRAVLGNIYGRLGHHSPSLAYYLPVKGPQNQKDKTSILTEWEELMWKQVEQSTPGSDRQKVWFDAYYEISQSSKALNRLVDLIKNRKTVPGLSLDQNRRWNIITHLSGFDVPDIQRLIEQERKADPSSDGQKSTLAAQAARPEIQKKDQWYSTVANSANGKTLAERRSIMRHLFPENQTKIRARYVERFFRDVMKLSKESNESLLDSFIDNLAPTLCTADSPRRLQKFIDEQGKNLPSYAIKSLRIAQQEDQRCTTIRAYAKSYDRKGIKG